MCSRRYFAAALVVALISTVGCHDKTTSGEPILAVTGSVQAIAYSSSSPTRITSMKGRVSNLTFYHPDGTSVTARTISDEITFSSTQVPIASGTLPIGNFTFASARITPTTVQANAPLVNASITPISTTFYYRDAADPECDDDAACSTGPDPLNPDPNYCTNKATAHTLTVDCTSASGALPVIDTGRQVIAGGPLVVTESGSTSLYLVINPYDTASCSTMPLARQACDTNSTHGRPDLANVVALPNKITNTPTVTLTVNAPSASTPPSAGR